MEWGILVIGFAFLMKGADLLVEGASALAKRMKVSDLVIGLTVVAFGTSTPELFVNIFASIGGNSEIAIGNILGSNIFNILVILGISALVYPLRVTHNTIWKEIPFSLLAAVMVFILANDTLIDGQSHSMISRIDGIVLLAFFFIFLCYVVVIARQDSQNFKGEVIHKRGLWKAVLFVAAGLAVLVFGGKLLVESAVTIARTLGVSESLIGLTIVAGGTSLPELATSAVAAYKKNSDIAVGNIVGSNIFNIFYILGVSAVIRPIPFSSTNNVDVCVTIFASCVLFASLFTGKKRFMERGEGVFFLVCYIVYIHYLVNRG